jgi:hypothetical protein
VKQELKHLDFVNSPGVPLNDLYLKVGSPVMLLRNLVPHQLCNCTRVQIKCYKKNIIGGIGHHWMWSGGISLYTTISINTIGYHFQFKRLQFPVKLCFAMTINKSQGQTLKMVGVDLREDGKTASLIATVCYLLQSELKRLFGNSSAATLNKKCCLQGSVITCCKQRCPAIKMYTRVQIYTRL